MAPTPGTCVELHADALRLAKAARRLLNGTFGVDLRDNLARLEIRSALRPFEYWPDVPQKGEDVGRWVRGQE